MLRLTFVAIALSALLAHSAFARPTIYVNESLNSGANDGTSWPNAFRGHLGLVAALVSTAPNTNTEIWVAQGTYAPAPSNGSPATSFLVPSTTRLLGGFTGVEVSADQRNPAAHLTILSGDLMNDDGKGVFDHTIDNSWHVVRITGASSTTLLDGFIIRDGYAWNGPEFIDTQGAGLLIEGGTPTVRACTFLDSRAEDGSGIAVLSAGQPLIEDCLFTLNNSGHRGAGIYLDGASATIRRCDFIENGGCFGVGIYIGNASPFIEECDFLRNTSPNSAPAGAGIGGFGGSPIVRNCRFIENRSQGGGGIHFTGSHIEITRCRFAANIGTGDGGDALVLRATATVTSCEFTGTGDRTDLDPSGILAIAIQESGTTRFINCTFANNGNSAGSAGPFSGHSALIVFAGGLTKFENCIIWGNASIFGNGQIAAIDHFTPTQFDRCIVQGWDGTLPSTGTVALDPKFADASGIDNLRGTPDDDVRLTPGSPGIDAGINAAVPPGDTLDVAGQPRFRDDPATSDSGIGTAPIVDLGALEFQPPPCAGDANGDGAVNFADITYILEHWGAPFTFGDVTATLAGWQGVC